MAGVGVAVVVVVNDGCEGSGGDSLSAVVVVVVVTCSEQLDGVGKALLLVFGGVDEHLKHRWGPAHVCHAIVHNCIEHCKMPRRWRQRG